MILDPEKCVPIRANFRGLVSIIVLAVWDETKSPDREGCPDFSGPHLGVSTVWLTNLADFFQYYKYNIYANI